LLDSPDVDLRIAAGEAIIVLYENACEHDEESANIAVESVLPKLEELSKDSHKYRSVFNLYKGFRILSFIFFFLLNGGWIQTLHLK
jgi:Interferon-related developmental regulator (IFRD)